MTAEFKTDEAVEYCAMLTIRPVEEIRGRTPKCVLRCFSLCIRESFHTQKPTRIAFFLQDASTSTVMLKSDLF